MYTKIRLKGNYVTIYYTSGGSTMRFKTGVTIESSKDWNKKKNELTSKVYRYRENMRTINKWKIRADEKIDKALSKDGYKISGRELKQYLDNYIKGIVLPKTTKLSALYKKYYNDKKEELVDNPNRSPESLKDYTSFKRTITDYENEVDKNLTISDVNKSWCKKFQKWLSKPRKKDALTNGTLKPRTIKKRFDTLKSFYYWLEEEGLTVNTNISALTKHNIIVPKAIIDTLTIEEARDLHNYIPSCERLEKVKDLFIFACHTGLRWFDIITIRKVHIKTYKKGSKLSKITHKSRNRYQERFEVPLTETALSIFEKYDYNLAFISAARANLYIKEVMKESEMFDDEMEKLNKEGEYMKRCEYFSFHDGRRSFITNLVNSAIPVNEIMIYTGHRKISTLQSYIDTSRPTSFNHIKILD